MIFNSFLQVFWLQLVCFFYTFLFVETIARSRVFVWQSINFFDQSWKIWKRWLRVLVWMAKTVLFENAGPGLKKRSVSVVKNNVLVWTIGENEWKFIFQFQTKTYNEVKTANLWIVTRLLIYVAVDLIASYARGFACERSSFLWCERLSWKGVVDGKNSLPIHVPYLGLFVKVQLE